MPSESRQQRPRSADHHPVVWTPEDAANFLSAAIKEAQKPFTQALLKQGVPRSTFAFMVLLMVAAGAGVFLFLREERDARATLAREIAVRQESRDTAWVERVRKAEQRVTEAREETMQLRAALTEAQALAPEADRLRAREAELLQKIAALTLKTAQMKHEALSGHEMAGKARAELSRLQARVTFMQAQMDGLLEEKQALAKQLDATRSLSRILENEINSDAHATPPASPTPTETNPVAPQTEPETSPTTPEELETAPEAETQPDNMPEPAPTEKLEI